MAEKARVGKRVAGQSRVKEDGRKVEKEVSSSSNSISSRKDGNSSISSLEKVESRRRHDSGSGNWADSQEKDTDSGNRSSRQKARTQERATLAKEREEKTKVKAKEDEWRHLRQRATLVEVEDTLRGSAR